MIGHSNRLDTSGELLLRRYRDGIVLERPLYQNLIIDYSISSFFSLPFSSYFVNRYNQCADANNVCLNIVGAQSKKDCLGSTLSRFANKELCVLVETNNNSVMKTERMKIFDESGDQLDNIMIEALSFKFPWYVDGRVVGLFGCSILLSMTSASELAKFLTHLISMDLLSNTQLSSTSFTKLQKTINSGLTFRENNVLSLILRGKTSKEIGKYLEISYKTVERHVENIKFKTGCQSKSDLFDRFA